MNRATTTPQRATARARPVRALPAVFLAIGLLVAGAAPANADLRLPPVFTDGAVLQHGVSLPVWGWAEPGQRVSVRVLDQRHEAVADAEGAWRVTLRPLSLRTAAHVPDAIELTIEAGADSVTLSDLLVGDVWLCSGQSNMKWELQSTWNGDMEIAKADRPGVRLLTVETPGSQTPTLTCDAAWEVCTPRTARRFSAVGYHFGLELHERFGVPIGLIDNAWGGSSCEAWTPRERLEGDTMYAALMERWRKVEATYDPAAEQAKHQAAVADWKVARAAATQAGEPEPRKPRWENALTGKHRPANLFHGRLGPIMPYAIKGAIWYQGEANASRAYQYRELFPLMIRSWRDAWGQGDFPFYWVQLADFKPERDEPRESVWAELREAQTMTLDREPNTGQAVIIDLGEGQDIHPRNKRDVALRLARLAMSDLYGVEGLDRESPRMARVEIDGPKATVAFHHVGAGLRTLDAPEVIGFTLAGADRVFHHAAAKIVGSDRVEVTCDAVPEPVAVRYAWADNPRCNLITQAGLPVTPLRSDDWPGWSHDAR
ncbi:MAG: sialate O-acetylesterase [Planctomycetota bacterium]